MKIHVFCQFYLAMLLRSQDSTKVYKTLCLKNSEFQLILLRLRWTETASLNNVEVKYLKLISIKL